MYYAGIDVGQNGGLAVIDENSDIVLLERIPIIRGSLDSRQFKSFLLKYPIKHLGIEMTRSYPRASAKSNHSFGKISGKKETCLELLEIPFTEIRATVWQREIWEASDLVKIPDGTTKAGKVKYKKDTKKTSLNAASRIFPGNSFIPTARSKNPHDGLIDAALIAEYVKRKGL